MAGRPLASLGWFSAAIYIGLAIVLFIVYPVILAANGLNPCVSSSQAHGLPSSSPSCLVSSIGTLPVTEQVTERNLGVPREYSAFAVPLGATTKMDGCAAIYPAISAILLRSSTECRSAFRNMC